MYKTLEIKTINRNSSKTAKLFKLIDNYSFQAKNLYNSALYYMRKEYIFGSRKPKDIISGFDLIRLFTKQKHANSIVNNLHSKIKQQTLIQVQQTFKSAVSSSSKQLPKYLNKKTGRANLILTNQMFSKDEFNKNGKLVFKLGDKTTKEKQIIDIENLIKKYNLTLDKIQQLRFVQSNNDEYKILLIIKCDNVVDSSKNINKDKYNAGKSDHYDGYLKPQLSNYDVVIGVDLGVNNLVSSVIVIGHNKEWKQDINIGKVNNQNFSFIPHSKLIEYIKYKAYDAGIEVVVTEESYTSKASFIDKDDIPQYGEDTSLTDNKFKFSGKRLKRGLYRTKENILINADINGAFNIIRKVFGNAIYGIVDSIQACSTPKKINI